MLASVAVQSVQYKVSPVAGLLIASLWVLVILGGNNPLVVLVTSKIALAFGEPVPIPIALLEATDANSGLATVPLVVRSTPELPPGLIDKPVFEKPIILAPAFLNVVPSLKSIMKFREAS